MKHGSIGLFPKVIPSLLSADSFNRKSLSTVLELGLTKACFEAIRRNGFETEFNPYFPTALNLDVKSMHSKKNCIVLISKLIINIDMRSNKESKVHNDLI